MSNAAYILGALSVVFLVLAARRILRDGGVSHPQSRTWLIVGSVFGVISLWLASGR